MRSIGFSAKEMEPNKYMIRYADAAEAVEDITVYRIEIYA